MTAENEVTLICKKPTWRRKWAFVCLFVWLVISWALWRKCVVVSRSNVRFSFFLSFLKNLFHSLIDWLRLFPLDRFQCTGKYKRSSCSVSSAQFYKLLFLFYLFLFDRLISPPRLTGRICRSYLLSLYRLEVILCGWREVQIQEVAYLLSTCIVRDLLFLCLRSAPRKYSSVMVLNVRVTSAG